MDVVNAIEKRRAYRSLEEADITDELINELARCAQLAPSCFNHQPWRYVFIRDMDALGRLREALSGGNDWAHASNLVIAVVSTKEADCSIAGRDYYLFDTGMATALLILRATEKGLVAHPIAGYDEQKAKDALGIPEDHQLITLIIVGKHSERNIALLADKHQASEGERPERRPLAEFAFIDRWGNGLAKEA